MSDHFVRDETYDNIDYTKSIFPTGTYESCEFAHCDFQEADLSNTTFIDCTFSECNLSNAKVVDTKFQKASFTQCKLIGWRFEDLDDFLLKIECVECTLDFASFYGVDLSRYTLVDCQLYEVDFTNSNCESFDWNSCNLSRAVFHRTNITASNFSSAEEVSINLMENQVKGAIFSSNQTPALLKPFEIQIQS